MIVLLFVGYCWVFLVNMAVINASFRDVINMELSILNMIDAYANTFDILLNKIPTTNGINKNSFRSSEYWDKVTHEYRQKELNKLRNIIAKNDVYNGSVISLNFSSNKCFKNSKYFWYLYVALYDEMDLFIETLRLTFDNISNTIFMKHDFKPKYFEFYNQNKTVIDIYCHTQNNVVLSIHTNFMQNLNINYKGFINDPWNSLYLTFNHNFYDRNNEKKFMKNMYKWRLSSKIDFEIHGLTCIIKETPCNFAFINEVQSQFSIYIISEAQIPFNIDLSNIHFGNNINEMATFMIEHIGSTVDHKVTVFVPKQKIRFVRTIRISGNIVLANMEEGSIELSQFIRYYSTIEVNPYLLNDKLSCINEKFNSFDYCRITIIKGFTVPLVLNLMDIYRNNYNGELTIFNPSQLTYININGFECETFYKNRNKVTYGIYCLGINGFEIHIRLYHSKSRYIKKMPLSVINDGIFGCLNCIGKTNKLDMNPSRYNTMIHIYLNFKYCVFYDS